MGFEIALSQRASRGLLRRLVFGRAAECIPEGLAACPSVFGIKGTPGRQPCLTEHALQLRASLPPLLSTDLRRRPENALRQRAAR